MIRNQREYRITKAEVRKFEQTLIQFDKLPGSKKVMHPRLVQAEKEAMQSQLASLREQIEDYEESRRGDGTKRRTATLKS
jgi:hemerythrin superfamily protein